GVLALRLSVVEDGEQGPQEGGRDGPPHDELTECHEEEAQILRMAHHGVNAIRDEDRPPFEDDLLPALVDEQDARDDEGGTNQLADAPYIPDERGRGGPSGRRSDGSFLLVQTAALPWSRDPDDCSGALFGLVQVVLRNRGHRLLQDFRILASPLREPGDDQQNRPKEEDRKPDELRRDRGALAVGSLHDEPLGQARNRGPRDTEEPSNVPVREEVHLSPFEVPVHVFAPRLLSRRPYQYIAPMKTRPITTWAAKPPTAHGQGVSRRKVPENGEPAILTPASGSTTGPL